MFKESEKGKTEINLERAEEIKENSSLQKLKLSVGSMATIKPLIRCFVTFKNVRKLEISNCILSKLHFMTIDNYIV